MEKNFNFSGTPPECTARPYYGSDGLPHFLEHLHHHYYYEVVEKNHAYDLFKGSFVYGHKHHDSEDASHKNEHTRNLVIIQYLLEKRRDLVEKYFRTPHPLKDYGVIWAELKIDPVDCDCNQVLDNSNNSILSNQEPIMCKAMPVKDETTVNSPFGCRFCDEVLDILVRGINRLKMFSIQIDRETFRQLLVGTLKTSLVANNVRMLSYFFSRLCDEKWIVRNWQKNIEDGEMVYKRNGVTLLKAKYLSPALYAATCDRDHIQHYRITIDDMITRIKKYHMK